MSRQSFTQGQLVEAYVKLAHKMWGWCPGAVTRQFKEGREIEVLAHNPLSDTYERRWVRNDRRLIRPQGAAQHSAISSAGPGPRAGVRE